MSLAYKERKYVIQIDPMGGGFNVKHQPCGHEVFIAETAIYACPSSEELELFLEEQLGVCWECQLKNGHA